MKLKNLSTAIAFTLCSTAAMANTYQGEVGLLAGQIDSDIGDADIVGINGEYFFDAVDTNNKPLAEAAFLQEAGGVHAIYTETDFDGAKLKSGGISIDHYFGDSIFYAGVGALAVDADGEKDDTWTVTAGVTPLAGWLLTTTYIDAVDYEFNLSSKYVTQLGGDTAINFELGYAVGADDEDDTISAALDYYFTRNLSLGAFTSSAEETATGVRGRYFFNEKISAEASYQTEDDVDTVLLGVAFRF